MSANLLFSTTAHGAKVRIPGSNGALDLLICGFSCVDFSPLNNNAKSLSDRGESGDTFFATLAYVRKFQPKMIILENVENAPWTDDHKKKPGEKSIAQFFEELGYATCFLKIDTKQYHIPQTRVRGYMLCIKKSLFDSLGGEEEVRKRMTRYKELMEKLKSPASAPVEAFLLQSDDPKLRAAMSNKGPNKPAKRADWDRCAVGHDIYRHDLGLGKNRPLTKWTRDGTPKLPDFYLPLNEQTNRIFDTLCIAHIRNARRGIDDRYYRYVHLSYLSPAFC